MRAFVSLPHTYAIAAAFLAISGIFFVTFLVQTNLPDLEQYYSNIATTLLVLIPIIAMRSFAEERRAGALDITLSWPLPRTALVIGKYLVNTAYTWLLLSVAWLYVRLLLGLGEVEVGKAAAGYVSILLLAAALGALALAVSARASSPTGAAFLGFGLLLGLWTLQFANRLMGQGLGRRVADISPANHLEAGARGVIDGGDVAYFLTCVVHRPRPRRPLAGQAAARGDPARRPRRQAARLGVVGATGVLLLVIGSSVEAQADLTPTKRFTITRQTKEIAGRVRSPVRVTGFVDPDGPMAVEMRALVRQYRTAHIPIELEMVDPDAQPGRAQATGVSRYGQMLVEISGRRELVPDVGEVALTSAILRLTRDSPATACFTVGHGEPDINDTRPAGYEVFAAYLRQLGLRRRAVGARGARGPGPARPLHGGHRRAPHPAAGRRAGDVAGLRAGQRPPPHHERPRRHHPGSAERAAAPLRARLRAGLGARPQCPGRRPRLRGRLLLSVGEPADPGPEARRRAGPVRRPAPDREGHGGQPPPSRSSRWWPAAPRAPFRATRPRARSSWPPCSTPARSPNRPVRPDS